MQLFYTTKIEDSIATLATEELRHLNVLRKKVGDRIQVVDGKGSIFEAEIMALSKKDASIVVQKVIRQDPLDFQLHLAIAPTKNIARFEWFLEKATEIGIQTITPIFCKHSERKKIRLDRLEKIVISAMKQSNRTYLPQLNAAQSFPDFLAQLDRTDSPNFKYIAHCEVGKKVNMWDSYQAKQDILILIGPEGDFHPTEIEAAHHAGFQFLSLGDARLRTETAGIVACHTVQLIAQMAKG
ncbi:MAG: 16S rRNA (uracil(1498)-N(3))-methyltransferase [Bacteroidota bacterium]